MADSNCNATSWHTVCHACGKCHHCIAHKPRTQKAKGLVAMQGKCGRLSAAPIKWLIQDPAAITCAPLPAFARPCPETAQHGYIDSRVVKTKEELTALWEQVHADDPKGEILLMEFINADHNMIWTPSLLVVGPGHDGATAGKDTISIPIVPPKNLKKALPLAKAGVGDDQWPYVEIVVPKGNEIAPLATQLRAGPPLECVSGDFIPKKTTIKRVIKADPKYKDLEWRDLINSIEDPKGVVVWHPGGALTDHFSIHSRTHSIPVLYGAEEPQIGAILTPPKVVPKPNPHAVLAGIVAGAGMDLHHTKGNGYGYGGNVGPAVSAILAGLHNYPALTGDAGKWIGVAVALMLRIGTIAMKGEMRHIHGSKTAGKLSREAVYTRGYKIPLSRLRASLNRLINGFRYGEFGGGAVGGPKWAACGKAMIPLFEGVRLLAQDPTPERVDELVRALNVVVNQAHNGGWWLNKFTDMSVFNQVQEGDICETVRAASVLWQAEKHLRTLTDAEVNKALTTFKKWPETRLVAPKVKSVEMYTREGLSGIQFRIHSTFMRGSRPRTVQADPAAFAKLVKAISADLYLVDDTNGNLAIEARGKGMEEAVTIWKEKDLDEIVKASMALNGAANEEGEGDDLPLEDDED